MERGSAEPRTSLVRRSLRLDKSERRRSGPVGWSYGVTVTVH